MWPVWTAPYGVDKIHSGIETDTQWFGEIGQGTDCSVLTLSVICSVSLCFLIARCTWASRGGRDGARSGYVQTPVVTAPLQTAWLPPWVSQVCQGLQLQQWAEDCTLESRSVLFLFPHLGCGNAVIYRRQSFFLICISFINLACRL